MKPRFFSLKEANALVPHLSREFDFHGLDEGFAGRKELAKQLRAQTQ